MKQKVTIELVTSASTSDIFTALSMLNPVDLSVNITPANGRPKTGGRGPDRQPRKKPGNGATDDRFRTKKPQLPGYDERVIWDSLKGRINVPASLLKLNLTRNTLEGMRTRLGTAEYVVKQGMLRQGASK